MIFLAKYWKWLAGAVLVLGAYFGTTAVLDHFRNKRFDADIASAKKADSAFKVQDTTSRRVDVFVDTVLKTLTVTHIKYIHDADSTQHLAETLVLPDTLKEYKLRWSLALQTDTTLRKVIRTDSVAFTLAIDTLKADRGRWKARAFDLDSSNNRITRDLEIARGGCHIVPFVRCPSRKVALLMGLGGGYLIASGKWRGVRDYLKGSRFVR